MRVAHVTDLHVEVRPTFGQLFNKRFAGALNLYAFGRSAHFSRDTLRGLIAAVEAAAPDAVVCTGDLTATATEAEYAEAARLLAPLTSRFPFVTLSGNHDLYTGESQGRFARHFGEWSNGGRFPFVWPLGPVDFVAVDSSRPDWLSRGTVGDGQLALLDTLLSASDRPAVVLLHYPLRGRHGEPYGPSTRALRDARAVEVVLARHTRVIAVWHGHEHHGYRTQLPNGVPSFDPGASGYAYLPARHRTAHFNLVTFSDDGRTFDVERQVWDGEVFSPEPGGAYASGG